MYSFLILKNLAFDFAYFPLWWYTRGFYGLVLGAIDFIIRKERSLSLLVWTRNLFVPMYGQHDVAGFLISFIVRLTQIIFRSFVMLFWLYLSLLAVLIWLALPFAAAYMVFLQASAGG